MNGAAKSEALETRDRLALLFREAQHKGLGSLLIFEGPGLGGVTATISRLAQVLDPRHFSVLHFPRDSAPLAGRPFLYEYWRQLPRYGDLCILHGSYYHKLVSFARDADLSKKRRRDLIQEILDFERALSQNNYVVFKIFIRPLHAGLKKELKKSGLSAVVRNSLRKRWKALIHDRDAYEDAFTAVRRATDVYEGPWYEPGGETERELAYSVFGYLIARMEEALEIDSRVAVQTFDDQMRKMRTLAGRLGEAEGA
jgi:AMP-polyphosphate phosphotransferase